MPGRPWADIERDVLCAFHGARTVGNLYRLNAEIEGNAGPVFGRRRRTIESAALFLPVDAGKPKDVLADTPELFDGVFAARLAECRTAHARAVETLLHRNLRDVYQRAAKAKFQPRYHQPIDLTASECWPKITYGDTAIRVPVPERFEYAPAPEWALEQEPIKAALRAMGANVP